MYEKLTVLIPTRNRAIDLHQALTNAKDCGLHEVKHIIYDDASNNASETIEATKVLPHVKILKGNERIGQAGGRNILLNECKTPYALFMDDDTWFTNAEELPRIIERDLYYDGIGKASAVCAQVFRTYDGETIFPNGLGSCRIINPLGAGCVVRVKDILRIGAFRGYWRYRHEETELGLRLWKHDLPVVYDSSLVLEHCHTGAARSSQEYILNSARNLILMHVLNLPGFFGMPLGIMRALRLLLVKNYTKISVLRGINGGISDTLKYRHDIQPMSHEQYKELSLFKHDLKTTFKKSLTK